MTDKITLNNVGSLIDATTAVGTINSNFQTIQSAFDNTLSRDGTSPNQMENNFDMNSKQILNLPAPATANSPLRLQDLEDFIGSGVVSSIPSGGTTHQVLAKKSNVDFDTDWENAITSVGLSLPADFTVTGSPVTTSGTLTGSWTTPPTGSGAVVRANAPILTTPNLGTPSVVTLSNATGLPVSTGISGLATGVSTFLATPTSANLAAAITDETGTGSNVFATSPTLVTPTLGVASATTINKVAITAPATSSTLTIANGATLTASANATVSGTNTGDQTITLTSDVTGTGVGSFATTIASNAVTNAKAAQMAANTIKGNTTSSTANAQDFTIDGLTLKASPVSSDEVMIWDVSGTAIKKTTIGAIGSAGSVASINGQTGAIVSYYPPQGRLTLTSGTPVMGSSVAAATTVYYTPAVGNMVPLYDGTNLVPTPVAEVSQVTTDTTKSPAAVAASSVYDIFVWNDSGTLRATRGPAWTNTTTRGYTFTIVNGIALNTSAITNGPAASRGTWVGTIASNGTSTIDFIFGASASGGVAASLCVWNTYNQVETTTVVTDSGTTYTYSSATTRQVRASAGNQITFVSGQAVNGFNISRGYCITTVAVAGAFANLGYGLDSTTSPFGNPAILQNSGGSGSVCSGTLGYSLVPVLGKHFVAMVETGDGTNANTFGTQASNLSFKMLM